MMKWPAIIKYHGSDELSYVATEIAWNGHAGLSAQAYNEYDVLIDNQGRVYQLNDRRDKRVVPEDTDSHISLPQLIKLVQAHAALNGECCIEKIAFTNFGEGLAIVASLDTAL